MKACKVARALVCPWRRYSPEQLYEVVSGVQHYHQFVPWCVRSNVLKQTPDGSYLEAELQIGFQMISERWVQAGGHTRTLCLGTGTVTALEGCVYTLPVWAFFTGNSMTP